MQQYPGDPQPQQQYPYSPPQTPSPPMHPYGAPPPHPPARAPKRKRRRGCLIASIIAVVLVIGVIAATAAASNGGHSANSPTSDQNQATSASTQDQPAQPIAPPSYPPKTLADLQALAQQGDASQIHEFHAESVGAVGVCSQPKRLVTVDPGITGQQLAEDLLAYFYQKNLDSPCGSLVFAYHSQAEATGDNGYTAGRVMLDTATSDGSSNYDPNATGLKYTLTFDTGDATTGQDDVVNYTK